MESTTLTTLEWASAVAAILVPVLVLAAPCKTDEEARADAVIGFFAAQALGPMLCEDRQGRGRTLEPR